MLSQLFNKSGTTFVFFDLFLRTEREGREAGVIALRRAPPGYRSESPSDRTASSPPSDKCCTRGRSSACAACALSVLPSAFPAPYESRPPPAGRRTDSPAAHHSTPSPRRQTCSKSAPRDRHRATLQIPSPPDSSRRAAPSPGKPMPPCNTAQFPDVSDASSAKQSASTVQPEIAH